MDSSDSHSARCACRLPIVTSNLAAIAGVLVSTCVAPSALAQGHGGGGGGGGSNDGTIYYNGDAGRKQMWTMEPDGSNKTQLAFGAYGPVSTEVHNGHRWFLDTRLVTYADGTQKSEVIALRDDYATGVQLTADVTVDVGGDGLFALQWLSGDEQISFRGRRRADGVVVEGGIYTVPLDFDAEDNLIGAQQPAALAVELPLNSSLWPDVRSYCWSPTGNMIAYEDTTALYVADLLDGTHTLITNQVAHTPQWSPDGGKIAFTNRYLGISIVKPDGTGLKEIVRRRPDWTFDRVFWSPDGGAIVFYGYYLSGPYDLDIFRATSSGKFLTNLTNSASTAEYTMGWR